MNHRTHSRLLAVLAAAFVSLAASAADSVPSAANAAPATTGGAADPKQPAIGQRVGGSPADAEFRAAIQASGDAYRQARTACREKKGDERSSCTKEAKATLRTTRTEAKAKHDQAVREARAAAKK